MKKKSILSLLVFSIGIVYLTSCEKEPESDGNLQPITFKSPATNPATVQRGQTINFEVAFETENLIDSVMVNAQIGRGGAKYDEASDTFEIFKMVYPEGDQSNIQSISGLFPLDTSVKLGDKVYLKAFMRAKSTYRTKRLTLDVL